MLWDSFDTLCGCDEQGQSPAGKTHTSLGSFAPAEPEISPIPANHDVSHSPSSPFIPTQTLVLACMWGNCQARFASLSDLVGHVNLEHLRLPSAPFPASASPNTVSEAQSDSSRPSCLWRNCTEFLHPKYQLPHQAIQWTDFSAFLQTIFFRIILDIFQQALQRRVL
jgi:hypothetical protein